VLVTLAALVGLGLASGLIGGTGRVGGAPGNTLEGGAGGTSGRSAGALLPAGGGTWATVS
jgi:hypothetical protein